MSTQAQKAAVRRYLEQQGRIDIRPPAELVAQAKAHALERGESLQGFVIRAIQEQMQRDKA